MVRRAVMMKATPPRMIRTTAQPARWKWLAITLRMIEMARKLRVSTSPAMGHLLLFFSLRSLAAGSLMEPELMASP